MYGCEVAPHHGRCGAEAGLRSEYRDSFWIYKIKLYSLKTTCFGFINFISFVCVSYLSNTFQIFRAGKLSFFGLIMFKYVSCTGLKFYDFWEPRKWIFTLCFCEVCVFNSRNKDFMLISRGFPGGSARKESICNVGDLGLILDWEDPLEKRTPTHSSIQAQGIP